MNNITEDYHEFINIDTEDAAYKTVIKRLLTAYRNGELEPGEWILIEDDGILIGKYDDFDADSIYNADEIETIINLHTGEIKGRERIKDRISELFN